MSANCISSKPLQWNWRSVTQGNTFPATNIVESLSDTDLVRVQIKFKDVDGVLLVDLDSDDVGITINDATAGSWDFTIDAMDAATTATFDPGKYYYDLKITDSAGIVNTDFKDEWTILPRITD